MVRSINFFFGSPIVPMLKIEQVSLEGFKCFTDRTPVTLDPTVNVFCGANGSGKSTVLEGTRYAQITYLNLSHRICAG